MATTAPSVSRIVTVRSKLLGRASGKCFLPDESILVKYRTVSKISRHLVHKAFKVKIVVPSPSTPPRH